MSAYIQGLGRDCRHASRSLSRTPGFTAAAVLIVAAAISLNASAFTLVDRLVFSQPIGVTDPGKVVRITNSWLRRTDDFVQLQKSVGRLELAVQSTIIDLTLEATPPQQITVRYVSRNYFSVLRAKLTSGHGFTTGSAGQHEAILSHHVWRNHFGGADDVAGSLLRVSGSTYRIVGVAGPGFSGIATEAVDLWLPIDAGPRSADGFWPGGGLWVFGRLSEDASLDQAHAELLTSYPVDAPVLGHPGERSVVNVSPIYESFWSRLRNLNRLVVLLIGASIMVLMISCANLSGLLINRLIRRREELAIRTHLGATRSRIIRLLLAEVVIVNLIAGVAGALLVYIVAPVLRAIVLAPMPGESNYSIGSPALPESVMSLQVLALAVPAALLTTALTVIAPILHCSSRNFGALVSGRFDLRGGRSRAVILATQVALTTILLIGAGLFVRSFRNGVAVDLGMEFDNVLVASVDLHSTQNPQEMLMDMKERLRGIPQVTHVALTHSTPMTVRRVGKMHVALEIPGFQWPWGKGRPAGEASSFVEIVSPEYFAALGMEILRGRGFLESDTIGQPLVVIIDERLSREVFRGKDPIGECVQFAFDGAIDKPFAKQCRRIVGIVSSVRPAIVRSFSDSAPYDPVFYVPVAQWGGAKHLIVRTVADSLSLVPSIKARLQSLETAYVTVEPLSWYHDQQTHGWRVGSALLGIYGVAALVLASVSTFSMVGFRVRQQRHEIGIRLALGATRGRIVGMIFKEGTLPVLLGLTVGVVGSMSVSSLVTSLIFGVAPTDLLTMGCVVLVISVAGVLAAVLPARHAGRTDPTHLLRCE